MCVGTAAVLNKEMGLCLKSLSLARLQKVLNIQPRLFVKNAKEGLQYSRKLSKDKKVFTKIWSNLRLNFDVELSLNSGK